MPRPAKRIYDRRRWRDRARPWQLSREPLCRACSLEGKITAAVEVDHIVAISAGGDLYHPSNLQSLCRRHHSQKTAYDKTGRDWTQYTMRGCHPDGSPKGTHHD